MIRYKEAYSQTAWRPVKSLVRTHLRKAVNKPQGTPGFPLALELVLLSSHQEGNP